MDMMRINWETTIRYCEELAKKIDFRPDIIVGISRGGLVPARILSDILGVKKVGILGISFYKGLGETEEKPEITQDLSIDVKGSSILLVDDVADSGKSLKAAKKYLQDGGIIKTATLHYKPRSEYKPDYFVHSTSAWIVYPWEVHEVERSLKSDGLKIS